MRTPEQSQLKCPIQDGDIAHPGFLGPPRQFQAGKFPTDAILPHTFNGFDHLELRTMKEDITVNGTTSPGLEREKRGMKTHQTFFRILGACAVMKNAIGTSQFETDTARIHPLRP